MCARAACRTRLRRRTPRFAVLLVALLAFSGTQRAANAVAQEAPIAALEPALGIAGPVALLALDPRPTGPVAEGRMVAVRGDRIEVWPAGHPMSSGLAGSIALGANVVDIVLDGETAWALSGDGAITSIGIADPERPRRLGWALDAVPRAPGLLDPGHPVVYTRLAVPAPGVLWRVGWKRLAYRDIPQSFLDAWDVSDPAAPRRTGQRIDGITGRGLSAHDSAQAVIAKKAGFGSQCMGDDCRLEVVNGQDPLAPRLAGRVTLDGWPHAVGLHGDRAWVVVRNRSPQPYNRPAPNGVLAIDLGDLSAPVALGWLHGPWDDVVALDGGALLRQGDLLAWADLSDGVPRIARTATWNPPPVAILRSGAGAVARLADGTMAIVEPATLEGPVRAIHETGTEVRGVVSAGERVLWRDGDDAWHIAWPDAPDRPVRTLGPLARAAAVVGERVWLGGPDGFQPVRLADGESAGARIPIGDVMDVAPDGSDLWLLRRDRLERWDVADPARPALGWTSIVPSELRLAVGGAFSGRLLVHDATGPRLVVAGDGATTLGEPLAFWRAADPADRGPAAWDGRHAAFSDGRWLRFLRIEADGSTVELAPLLLETRAEALLLTHDRVYAHGKGTLDVIDLAGGEARWQARAESRIGASGLAIAGDRLFAAAGPAGLAAFRLPAPDRPAILERCGTTNRPARSVAVASAGATTVTLRVDGAVVGTSAPAAVSADDAPAARFDVALGAGEHVLDAIAAAPGQPPRTSEPVRLAVDPLLAFDPLGVTLDDGAGRGPAGPRGADGCTDPEDGWRVVLDARRAIAVRVPVRPDLADSARVHVTVGERSAELAPEAPGASVFAGTVLAAASEAWLGEAAVRIAVDGPEPAVWAGLAIAPRVWLPWAGR